MNKGYTGIIVEWHTALSRNRGWVIQTDQKPWARAIGDMETVLKKIRDDYPDLSPKKDINGSGR